MTQTCDFDPQTGGQSLSGKGCQNPVWWSLGGGLWRLCDKCSLLPAFFTFSSAHPTNEHPVSVLIAGDGQITQAIIDMRRKAIRDWKERHKKAMVTHSYTRGRSK